MLNKSIDHFIVKMLIVSIISTGANFYKVGAGCCFSKPSGDTQSEEKQPLVRGNSLASYTDTESNQTEVANASSAAANIIKNIQLAQKKVAENQLPAAKSALTNASIELRNNEALFVRYPGVFVQEDIDPERNYTNLQNIRDSLSHLNRTIEEQEQAKHKKAMADKFYNDISSRIARLNMATDDLETAGKQYEEINTLLNTQGGNVLEEGQVTNLRQQLEAVCAQLTKVQQEKEAARVKAETERKAKLEEEARIKAEQEKKAKLEAETRVKA
ncbi:MAG: cell envelope integrity protein TolA, partial [Oscillospiraceae bacterium]